MEAAQVLILFQQITATITALTLIHEMWVEEQQELATSLHHLAIMGKLLTPRRTNKYLHKLRSRNERRNWSRPPRPKIRCRQPEHDFDNFGPPTYLL